MYEGAQKGRALALKNAENKLKNIFFLSNGDTLLDFNLLDLKENFLKEKLILREFLIRILLLEVLQKDKPLMHQFKVVQQILLS